ncbi:MAG: VTT domain-containing protein [Gemmatimonadales bacterium]
MTRPENIWLRRRGTPLWDGVLRATGLLGLVAIGVVIWWPSAAGLVAFLVLTIFVNGPLAPLLPATYEPILMVTGRVYPPVIVAMVGIVGTLYIEFLNYHLYRVAIQHPRLEAARDSRLVRATVRMFERAPFFTVWLCAWSPLPYWAVRFLAPLAGYPVKPYLFATFLGRAPRLWFFAALGLYVSIPTYILVLTTLLMIAVAVLIAVTRAQRATRVVDFQRAPRT